jgi:hypothetical protein
MIWKGEGNRVAWRDCTLGLKRFQEHRQRWLVPIVDKGEKQSTLRRLDGG